MVRVDMKIKFFKIFIIALFFLLSVFGLVVSASPVEEVYPQTKPSASLYVFTSSNPICSRINPVSESTNSGFINNASFSPTWPLSTDLSGSKSLVTFTYDVSADFYLDYVYQFDIVVHNAIWSSSSDFDPSGVMFGFSVFEPTTQYNQSIDYNNLDLYFPLWFKPVKVSKNSSRWVLTYNVPFYASKFKGYLTENSDGTVTASEFGFLDTTDAIYHSKTVSSNNQTVNYRFGLYSISVNRMSSDEALAWAIDNQTTAISEAISAQTVLINNKIDSSTQTIVDTINQPLPSASPYPGLDSISQTDGIILDGIQDLQDEVTLTNPFGGAFDSDVIFRGASIVRPWLQYFYEHNSLVNLLTSASLGIFLFVAVFRGVF